jgi:hypothetical protein
MKKNCNKRAWTIFLSLSIGLNGWLAGNKPAFYPQSRLIFYFNNKQHNSRLIIAVISNDIEFNLQRLPSPNFRFANV